MPNAAQTELAAILHGAAIAPLTDRAFLRITGADATRWLNGMVTNSIQALAPGEGSYNLLLNAQGRIQADCTIFREPDGDKPAFVLETDKSQIDTIQAHLDHFIIMDDVELTPLDNLFGILVAGPQALSIVMALGTANQQSAPCSAAPPTAQPQTLNLKQTIYAGSPVSLIRAHSPLVPRFEIWSDPSTIASILAELRSTSALPASPEALEAFRILEARPLFGRDITDKYLPQEINQPQALHFAKGCYLGQEIVERIRSRGQVHRLLTPLVLAGSLPTQLPAPIQAALDGPSKPVGEITSAALVPLPEGPQLLALGYVRREALDTRQTLTYNGGTAAPRT
jgi:folate-binding protein YgfZ